jgi:hypothetical protein
MPAFVFLNKYTIMRAREFTINVPITIKINGDSDPIVTQDESVDDDTGTFVPPLQQKIELLKKSAGVKSVFDDEDSAIDKRAVLNQEAGDDEPLD